MSYRELSKHRAVTAFAIATLVVQACGGSARNTTSGVDETKVFARLEAIRGAFIGFEKQADGICRRDPDLGLRIHAALREVRSEAGWQEAIAPFRAEIRADKDRLRPCIEKNIVELRNVGNRAKGVAEACLPALAGPFPVEPDLSEKLGAPPPPPRPELMSDAEIGKLLGNECGVALSGV